MKLFKNTKPTILLLMMLTVILTSCSLDTNDINDEQEQQQESTSLADLQGNWIRVGGNNPINNGLKVSVQNNTGVVVDPQQSGFIVGDVKWDAIFGLGSGDYEHQELGSDYNYYPATIKYGVDDTLRIDVNHSGAGNIQKWVREANFTPQSVFLEELVGNWIRVGGNNPTNNGVLVNVVENTGTITDASLSEFNIGDIKWKEVYALDANSFIYEELGSDYNYYPASMEIGVADTLRISVNYSGSGNIQKWIRQ